MFLKSPPHGLNWFELYPRITQKCTLKQSIQYKRSIFLNTFQNLKNLDIKTPRVSNNIYGRRRLQSTPRRNDPWRQSKGAVLPEVWNVSSLQYNPSQSIPVWYALTRLPPAPLFYFNSIFLIRLQPRNYSQFWN